MWCAVRNAEEAVRWSVISGETRPRARRSRGACCAGRASGSSSGASTGSARSCSISIVPSSVLAIEIDGAPHLTDDGRRYDAARSRKLESLGVRVARFSNNAVYASPDWFGAQVRALIEERREEISKMRSVVIDVRRP